MRIFNIALFGPQGSGKGTQGEKLAEYLKIPLIITGNIFRLNIKEQTTLGKTAQEYINKGALVPNEITIKMVTERLAQNDCRNGFIIDGFPRTLAQAEVLHNLTHVVLIDITDAEAIQRIANRRQCVQCGATYHTVYKPSKKEGICDNCHQEITQRTDDTESALAKRLKLYHSESEPVLEKYKRENILHIINGEQPINKVWEDVKKIFA